MQDLPYHHQLLQAARDGDEEAVWLILCSLDIDQLVELGNHLSRLAQKLEDAYYRAALNVKNTRPRP